MRTIDFLDKRVNGICAELKKLSVKQKFETSNWLIKPGNLLRPEDADADPAPFEPFDSRTMHWYGPDKHYWFRADVTVPQEMDGKPLWMHVCTQIDEWDDAKNPQFLLFVDGKVTQGVDMNHRDILLDRHAQGGRTYRLELQSYTGILHTEFNLIVDLREIDPEIEGLYYDLVVPLEAFPRLEEDGKSRRDLENVLNEAVNLIDLRTPYNESFYQSVAAARAYLAKALYTDLAGHDEVIASCIGHTHIDVAWWWTVAQTREKVCRSFATVLKLMEEYPNYKFMSSQPQLYYFLKQRYPELYEQIKQRVAEGRWEPEGGMWVEADCNLTSGESLVRQFLYGKRFFKEEFGVDNRILWLPDVFGYSGALPQIMAKCGIDYFMTTKLAWNQFNKMPYDTFKWRGIDGTEILTHLVTTLGVGQSENDFFTTYNGILHPDALIGGWHRYQQKDINNDILISYGYGDGGGGPTRAMLETSTRMEKGIEGLPKVRQAFARTYFDELAKRVEDNRRLPTWEGELYFEYHRGTYTSMARNKRSNRKIELHMMDLELLSLLAQAKIAYEYLAGDAGYTGFLVIGTVSLVLSAADAVLLATVRENPVKFTSKMRAADILLPAKDPNYRPLLFYSVIGGLTGGFASPFLSVYELRVLGLSHTFITSVGIVSAVIGMVGSWVWGRLADRTAWNRVIWLTAFLNLSCTLLWSIVRKNTAPFIAPILIIVAAACAGGSSLASTNLQFSLAPENRKTAYFGVTMAMSSIATCTSAAVGTAVQPILERTMGDNSIAMLFFVAGVGGFVNLLINGRKLPAVH